MTFSEQGFSGVSKTSRFIWFALFAGGLILTGLLAFFFAQGKSVEKGVYRIVAEKTGGVALGSSVLVDDGMTFVTNFHVIRGAQRLYVVYLEDGSLRKLPLRQVWQDVEQDLVFLKTRQPVPGQSMVLADIAEEDLRKTDPVVAIGFPYIADAFAAASGSFQLDEGASDAVFMDPTVSTGSVERLLPTYDSLQVQHSANVNSGNSGGPLVDGCGRVIGINTAKSTSGNLASSVHVREVIAALKTEKVPYRASSGRCISGFDRFERLVLAGSGAASLAFLVVGFVMLARKKPGFAPYVSPEAYPAYSGPAYTGDAAPDPYQPAEGSVAALLLTEKASGRSHSFADYPSLLEGGGVILGRDKSFADVVINGSNISRKHARISLHPTGDYVINDLGSTNGTKVDGSSASETRALPLRKGSILLMGDTELHIELTGSNSITEYVGAGLSAQERWLLSGFDANGVALQIVLDKTRPGEMVHGLRKICFVGRGQHNDFVIADSSVSRTHAVIGVDSRGNLGVYDMGSSNGTFVDGARCVSDIVSLEKATKLVFGNLEFSLSQHG
jgi:pSer/pThr/pTyr-binding forkhead associated (FHA) protein